MFVKLTGSRKKITVAYQTLSSSIAANGGVEIVNVYASAGYIALLKDIYFEVGAPTEATSGSHRVVMGISGWDQWKRFVDVSATYSQNIRIGPNQLIGTLALPSSIADFTAMIHRGAKNFAASSTYLYIRYMNNTDVATTQTRTYYVVALEEAVVS